MRFLLPLFLACSLFAEDAPVASLDVDKIILDFDNTIRAHTQKLIAAKSDADRATLSQQFPKPDALAPTMLRIAQQHPTEAESTKAMNWLVSRATNLPEGQAAVTMLRDQAAARKGLTPVLDFLAHSNPILAEPILRVVREKNQNIEEKASATYGLGTVLFGKSQGGDAAALAEASQLLKEMTTTYKDVIVNGFKLSDQAAATLFEIENIQPGKPMPEIEGKDADGVAFKLSDYRGKVAVVIFWGSWCHACHGTLDGVRTAVQVHGDKVVMLGVNTDPSEKLKELIKTENISWRNWADEYNRGPISALFNIAHWPTIFVVDGKGVLRGKDVPSGNLDKVITEVLAMP
jgi:peroxiredoxin